MDEETVHVVRVIFAVALECEVKLVAECFAEIGPFPREGFMGSVDLNDVSCTP